MRIQNVPCVRKQYILKYINEKNIMYLKMLNVNRENALDVRKMYRNNETREKRRKTKKLLQ